MKRFIVFALMLIMTQLHAERLIISDYQRTYVPVFTQTGALAIAIRTFKRNNVPSFLLVDAETLHTSVVPIAEIILRGHKKTGFAHWQIASTRYDQLLQKYSSRPYKLENYGITHANNGSTGQILTVDLCPSSAAFEKDFFDQVAALANKEPIPIVISISGMWLLTHKSDFEYLVSLQQKNKLAITWVNHSFSHPYYKDVPYPKNFLLSPTVNEDSEILLTEQYLLEANQVPSVFFRFPGLVSHRQWIMKLKQFGLLPLGTDSWIAKNEPIHEGSIILVHGNGNEHQGILMLLPMLKQLKWISIHPNI